MKRFMALGVLCCAVGCSAEPEGAWQATATDYIVEQCDAGRSDALADDSGQSSDCSESIVTFQLVGFGSPDSNVVVDLGNGTLRGERGAVFDDCLLRMELTEPVAIEESERQELEAALERTTVGRRDSSECHPSETPYDGDYRMLFLGETRFSERACDVLDGEDEAYFLADSLFDQRATVIERLRLVDGEWVEASVEACPSPGGR